MGLRPRRRSGVSWLALGYAALVAYASLYPFSPWDWPTGLTLWRGLRLEWPRYWSEFDVWANAVGYMPLGLLVFAAAWRSGVPGWQAGGLALALPAFGAYALEVAQRFVALRVPSLADWVLNSSGALCGGLVGAFAAQLGWLERWGQWRERWFAPQASTGLALLALWPLGLLFPLPAPLAQGQFLPPVWDALEGALRAAGWLAAPLHWGTQTRPIDPMLGTALGLLAPCLLLLAVAKPGWRRMLLVLSVVAVAVGASALATALSFGPENAWAWLNRDSLFALAVALTLALLAVPMPARASAVLAVPVLTGLILVVGRMDPDPYVLLNLQRWEQAPHIRLYGLLQWLGRLWPLLALGWVMAELARGGEPKIVRPVPTPRQ